jgi:hypothetical protein
LKQRVELGWDLLLVLSLIGIGAASWFAFLAPKPAAKPVVNSASTLKGIESETDKITASCASAEDHIKERTWDLTVEVFGSQILDNLTNLSQKTHVQLAGFRIGKPIQAATLQEAPFVATVEGTFMDVMAFVSKLEQADSKVALSQLNIATGNGSDHVSATLALTGFLYKEDQ